MKWTKTKAEKAAEAYSAEIDEINAVLKAHSAMPDWFAWVESPEACKLFNRSQQLRHLWVNAHMRALPRAELVKKLKWCL